MIGGRPMQNELEQSWLALWQRIGAQGDPVRVFNDLVARYSEPHRVYHTLEHIRHCLCEFWLVRDLATNPAAVEMALWYHDAVYATGEKPGAKNIRDNEGRSADLATQVCEEANLPQSFTTRVARLILETRHERIPAIFDRRLIVDIDLSILGQSATVFDEYERRIREEYVTVPDHVFAARRSEILRSFISPQRQFIYSTKFFQDKYEKQARANIIRSLERLKQLSP